MPCALTNEGGACSLLFVAILNPGAVEQLTLDHGNGFPGHVVGRVGQERHEQNVEAVPIGTGENRFRLN